ncbi:MAG: ABC transporter permease [Proteobacteria bacterium]|nr:ABC transporter permease [Pseudomonadota bacterium]
MEARPREETPIVPPDTISGRSFTAVVAIMTLLAALTSGCAMLVLAAADDWRADVTREVTIQIKPNAGKDIEAEMYRAAELARALPGIAEARPYSRQESARLLEPWLGTLASIDLPLPRIIAVRVAEGQSPDLAALKAALARQVPDAILDDHRRFAARMQAMAGSTIAAAIGVLALVLGATILMVGFATRGAMATNRPIIEVLHVIGASEHYIARQFQRRFLILGLRGGVIGGGGAAALFLLASLMVSRLAGSAGADQMAPLFGSFSIGAAGYAGIGVQILLIAAVAAATSRHVVRSTLSAVQ